MGARKWGGRKVVAAVGLALVLGGAGAGTAAATDLIGAPQHSHSAVVDTPEPGDTPDAGQTADTPEPGDTPDATTGTQQHAVDAPEPGDTPDAGH